MKNQNSSSPKTATFLTLMSFLKSGRQGDIRWDEFLMTETISVNRNALIIDDALLTELAVRCESAGFANVRLPVLRKVVHAIAKAAPFDSMRDWLSHLPRWDRTRRIERFLPDFLGTRDHPYERAVGRYWWTAVVSRILVPGYKADMVPVLVGRQGIGKTRLLETMAPSLEHYADVRISDRSSDLAPRVMGKVIVAWEELRGIRGRVDADEVKTFITNRYLEVRSRTKAGTDQHLRRFIIVGTSNRKDFLRDATGHRRYLPFDVHNIDLGKVGTNKLQLWAEAFHTVVEREQAGLPHVDFEEAELLASVEHQNYINQARWVDDPVLLNLVKGGGSRFSTLDALKQVGVAAPTKFDRSEMRKTLEQLGMEYRSTYFRNEPHRPKTWQWPVESKKSGGTSFRHGNS